MKYIITTEQHELISESELKSWVKRRLADNNIIDRINNVVSLFSDICHSYGDEFDFADDVIYETIYLLLDEFPDNNHSNHDYDEVTETMTDILKEKFADYLFDIYKAACKGYYSDI